MGLLTEVEIGESELPGSVSDTVSLNDEVKGCSNAEISSYPSTCSDIINERDQCRKEVNDTTKFITKTDDENPDNSNSSLNEHTEVSNPVPIDRGWAWMVLLGAIIEMTIVIGLQKSSGILFIVFQDRFKSSSSLTSLLSTVQNGVFSIASLGVMTLGRKIFSSRSLVFAGAILVSVAYIITSRATDIRVLLFSHGVLHGIALALIQPTTLVMIGTYFDKKRGMANSLAISGSSLGGLIFAPLLTKLLETYGYQGCMLIVSGLLLNACISASLFRSHSFYTKHQKKYQYKVSEISSDNGLAAKEKPVEGDNNSHPKFAQMLLQRQISKVSNHSISTENREHLSPKESKTYANGRKMFVTSNGDITITVKEVGQVNSQELSPLTSSTPNIFSDRSVPYRTRTYTESSVHRFIDSIAHSPSAKYASSEYMGASMLDLAPPIALSNTTESKENSVKKESLCKSFTKLFDIKLFTKPVFCALMLSCGLLCSGNALSTVFVAPYAKEVGTDTSRVAQLITIYSAIDLCSRMLIGVIADRQWVRRSTLVGSAAIVTGTMAMFVRFYTSFPTLVMYVVCLGLFSGVYFSLFAVVIVDYMTLAKLQPSLGFTTVFHGSIIAFSFYFVGYLRDFSGSYVVSFHYLGSLCLGGGCLMLLLPMFERWSKRQEDETRADD